MPSLIQEAALEGFCSGRGSATSGLSDLETFKETVGVPVPEIVLAIISNDSLIKYLNPMLRRLVAIRVDISEFVSISIVNFLNSNRG